MKTKPAVLVLVMVTALLQTANIHAQTTNPPYLSQFPTAERIKADIKGSDAVDTSARQMGAYWQLMQMIKTLAGPRFQSNAFTRDENNLLLHYGSAWQWYQYKTNSPPPQEQARWRKLRELYEKDAGVREELLQKFFSAEFRNAFQAGTLGKPATQAATAVLSAATGFSSQAGAANPLAGTALILMKESFGDFLIRNRMLQGRPGSPAKESPLVVWAISCRIGSELCKETMLDAQGIFIEGAKMDASGKTIFPAVPPGSYYVLGQGVANKQHLVWDVKVELKPGANSLILDERNITLIDATQATAKAYAPGPGGAAGGGAPNTTVAVEAANTTVAVGAADPSIAKAKAAKVDTTIVGLQFGGPLPRECNPLLGLDSVIDAATNTSTVRTTCVYTEIKLFEGLTGQSLLGIEVDRSSVADIKHIKLSKDYCPAWVADCSAHATVHNGRLSGVALFTMGRGFEKTVTGDLRAKYGPPTRVKSAVITPDVGNPFKVNEPEWILPGIRVEYEVVVRYDGNDERIRTNEGVVRIMTESEYQRRLAKQVSKPKPKL